MCKVPSLTFNGIDCDFTGVPADINGADNRHHLAGARSRDVVARTRFATNRSRWDEACIRLLRLFQFLGGSGALADLVVFRGRFLVFGGLLDVTLPVLVGAPTDTSQR
jgi:hypothetical protein